MKKGKKETGCPGRQVPSNCSCNFCKCLQGCREDFYGFWKLIWKNPQDAKDFLDPNGSKRNKDPNGSPSENCPPCLVPFGHLWFFQNL